MKCRFKFPLVEQQTLITYHCLITQLYSPNTAIKALLIKGKNHRYIPSFSVMQHPNAWSAKLGSERCHIPDVSLPKPTKRSFWMQRSIYLFLLAISPLQGNFKSTYKVPGKQLSSYHSTPFSRTKAGSERSTYPPTGNEACIWVASFQLRSP